MGALLVSLAAFFFVGVIVLVVVLCRPVESPLRGRPVLDVQPPSSGLEDEQKTAMDIVDW